MRQICVIGLGLFGSHLAENLTALGCEVLAVDKDKEKVNAIRDKVVQAVTMDVRDRKALESVVPKSVDAVVVSLGESVEASIMCTLHLKNMGIPYIVAKAISQDHKAILEAVGAHKVLFPERDMARRTARTLLNPNFLEYLPLPGGYRVDKVETPRSFHGKTLKELDLRNRFGIMVLAVEPADKGKTVFLPPADYSVKKGDTLFVAGKSKEMDALEKSKG